MVVLHEQVASYADASHPECLGRGYRGMAENDETLCDCARERFLDAYMMWGIMLDAKIDCLRWGPELTIEPGKKVAEATLNEILLAEGERSKKIREAEEQRAEKDAWDRRKN